MLTLEVRVKSNNRHWILVLFAYACAVIVLANHALAAKDDKARQLSQGVSAKISGLIMSRDADLIRVRDKRSGEVVVLRIDDSTTVERTKSKLPFYRHVDMDVTALLPGLAIEAEGVGNSVGQLDARKISFNPDEFAIVPEQQQVLPDKASSERAQGSADLAANQASQGQALADQAQNSAVAAQNSGNPASTAAQTAALGLADTTAGAALNQRVSELDGYKNEFEVDVFFPEGSTVLSETAKRDLANLADIAKSVNGYMIEISGYAAHYKFSLGEDQKLSEERAAVVARYFLDVKNIPIRRILVPVGYGATHPVASNQDAQGRELNRHVDIKVLVNKSIRQAM
jgi:outer membrane protein OmpA-like peptidoglycan-associated protein